jgi:NADH-quinone oxidoreductase subunit L
VGNLLTYAWVLPLLPLAAFVFVLATGRRVPNGAAAGAGIVAMAAVFVASCVIGLTVARTGPVTASVPWLHLGPLDVAFGVRLDGLSSLMLFVVSLVSLLVQIYSIGYMHGEERFRWYYGAISLFTAAMLGVALADNWLLMYMCWELMGLSSYLLIGFWYEQEAPPPAAMKAFLVTRLGDVGFGLALVVVWLNTRTFSFEGVFRAVETGAWAGPSLLAASLLFLAGAMGKSAQFPLHVWLPDAMAGPTPGSALIHAATMVAAGVYLVARSFPLFEANPVALTIVGTIGAVTALFGALVALAMNDIKKVLAYSTISQLGYMFLALGTGSWVAAIFHLFTHAFFKALLFLCAGSVIHSTDTQDVRELGGLARKMPWTATTWVIGALALAGIPPLAGFWSKDEILLAASRSGRPLLVVAGLVTAALTAFYMGRVTILTFFGPAKGEASSHAHESPRVMTWPLAALAALAATAGLAGSPMAGYALARFLGETTVAQPDYLLMSVAVAVALAGIGVAYLAYERRAFSPDGWLQAEHGPLSRRFWVDELYAGGIVRPLFTLAELLRRADYAIVDGVVRGCGVVGLACSRALSVFDRKGVDGAVDGVGSTVTSAGGGMGRIETGNVQTYLMLLIAGIVILVVVFAR